MRNYSPVQGRWWTPDPAGLAAVDPANPQSWNRYAYVDGQPLTSTDPLGLTGCLGCVNISVTSRACTTLADFERGGTCYLPQTDCNSASCDIGQFEIYCFATGDCPGYFDPPEVDVGAPGGGGSGGGAGNGSGQSRPDPLAGTIGAISRSACASLVADSEYSIAAHTSGDLPQNPVVQALLGNGVSGLIDLWNAPSAGSAMKRLVVGGVNPGLPDGSPFDQGVAGATVDAAIKAAAANIGTAAGEIAASAIGWAKFAYDFGSWAYAWKWRCSN